MFSHGSTATSPLRTFDRSIAAETLINSNDPKEALVDGLKSAIVSAVDEYSRSSKMIQATPSIEPEVLDLILKSKNPPVQNTIDYFSGLTLSGENPDNISFPVKVGTLSDNRLYINLHQIKYLKTPQQEGLVHQLSHGYGEIISFGKTTEILGEDSSYTGEVTPSSDSEYPNTFNGSLVINRSIIFKGAFHAKKANSCNKKLGYLMFYPIRFDKGELSTLDGKISLKGEWREKPLYCRKANGDTDYDLCVYGIFEGEHISHGLFKKGVFHPLVFPTSAESLSLADCVPQLKTGTQSFVSYESHDSNGNLERIGYMTGVFDHHGRILSGMVTHPNGDITEGTYTACIPGSADMFLKEGKLRDASSGKTYFGKFAFIPELFAVSMVEGVVCNKDGTTQAGKFVYSPEKHGMVLKPYNQLEITLHQSKQKLKSLADWLARVSNEPISAFHSLSDQAFKTQEEVKAPLLSGLQISNN